MKRSFTWLVCSAIMVLCWYAVPRADDMGTTAENAPAQEQQVRGGIATLYALDPLARTFCLRDGGAGIEFVKHRVSNRCSDLKYSLGAGGILTTGIELNRVGAIIDLGTADELRERYGFDDAAGGGEGFASLRAHEGKLVILKEDRPNEKLQPLKEAAALFAEVKSSANAPIKLGHIYLVHIADTKDGSFQVLAKLMVIGYTPNQSVTLRWGLL